jgi:hypothetical protein
MIEQGPEEGKKSGDPATLTRREKFAAYDLSDWEDWMESAGWWLDLIMTDLFERRARGMTPLRILLPRLRISTARGDGSPLGRLFGIPVRESGHSSIVWEHLINVESPPNGATAHSKI